MGHIINIYNRDLVTGTLAKAGTMTLRYSTGEAYVVITNTDGTTKEVQLKAEGYRRFKDFLNKNKIITNLPTTLNDIENRTHIYIDKATVLPETLPVVSVTDVLIERTMSNLKEWEELASVDKAEIKRLSYKTLGEDVEIEDLRMDPNNPTETMGMTDAESLLNFMLDLQLDLDDVFDKSVSNKGLTTDADGAATQTLTLKFRTMSNPMTEIDETKYDNVLLNGAAGLQIKNKFKETIGNLKLFNNMTVSNVDATGATQTKTISATDNSTTINIVTKESDGIISAVENNKVVFRHAPVGNVTTNAAYQDGKVMSIGSIKTDDKGHIIAVGLKDLNDEIKTMYYDKATADTKYIKKTNTGTEVLNGSLEVRKSVKVVKDLYVGGNLYTTGETTDIEADEFTIKDNIFEIGTGATSNRQYTGIKLVKASETGVDNEGRDAFLLFDSTAKRFVTVFGRTSEADPNTVYDIVAAPIKASEFIGNATTASAFKNPIKIQFMGDASGAIEFYGNETSIVAELNVAEATTTSFGTVRMVNNLDMSSTATALELNDIYSAQAIQPVLLAVLNDFKLSSSYEMSEDDGSATYIATSKAVYDVYKKLLAFREKYDANALVAENNKLLANTKEVDGTYELAFVLSRDTTVPLTLEGYGYDIRNYDNTITESSVYYPEYWKASFKMVAEKFASGSIVANIMPRTTLGDLYRISQPLVEFVASPYTMSSAINIVLHEYADGNVASSNGTIKATYTNMYFANQACNEITNKDVSEVDIIPVKRFYNHLDLTDFMNTRNDKYNGIYLSPNYTTDSEKQTLSFYMSNVTADNPVAYVGAMLNPYRTTGVTGGPETRPTIVLGPSHVNQNDASIGSVSGFGITVPGLSINCEEPYAFMMYFKLEGNDRTEPLRIILEESYTTRSVYGFHMGGKTVTRYSEVLSISATELNNLKANNWYCAIGFIHTQSSTFADSEQLAGVYDVQEATNATDYKKKSINYKSFPTLLPSSYKVTRRKLSLYKGTSYGVSVAYVPVLTKYDTNGKVAIKASISDTPYRNYHAIYDDYENGIRSTNDTVNYQYLYTHVNALKKPDRCYEMNVVAYNQAFGPNSDLVLATDTEFGIDVDDATTLLDPSATESVDGYQHVIQQDKTITIVSKLSCPASGKVLETANTDIWIDTIPTNENILIDRYFTPQDTTVIHIDHDNTVTGAGNPMTYKYSSSQNDWVAIGDMYTSIRWLQTLSYVDGLINYKEKTLGQIVTVTIDNSADAIAVGLQGISTWYYYTNESGANKWQIMPTKHANNLTEYVVTEGSYTPPVDVAAALTLITSQQLDVYDKFVVLKFSDGVKHWFHIVDSSNDDVIHLGVYMGKAEYIASYYSDTSKASYLVSPIVNDAAVITFDSDHQGVTTWYKYYNKDGNGNKWNYMGEYALFSRKCIRYSPDFSTGLAGETALTINNHDDIAKLYHVPSSGDYIRVGTGSTTTDIYYQYVELNWVYKGLKSAYINDLPYKKLTGDLELAGTLRFPMRVAYSYTKYFSLV